MSKVTVVGAGNVGATCANVLAFNEVADEVVMLDVKEGVSEGKAMDMMQTAQLLGFDTTVTGCTNDYEKTANSDVVVITSGIPRKPGMTREELIGVNAGIVKSVAQNILKYSPNAILVVISNPMDTMTYLSLKSLGLPKNRIIGMGGALDSSRFKYFLSQALGCNANEVEGMVIGGHGDTTMIPLARLATYKGIPVSKLLSAEKLQEVAVGYGMTECGLSCWVLLHGMHRVQQELMLSSLSSTTRRRWFLVPFTWKVNTENPIFASAFLLSWVRTVSKRSLNWN